MKIKIRSIRERKSDDGRSLFFAKIKLFSSQTYIPNSINHIYIYKYVLWFESIYTTMLCAQNMQNKIIKKKH